MRACQDPSPVIDGRRANCNLASLGASNRTRPPAPQYAMDRFRPQRMLASAYRGPSTSSMSTAYYHHPVPFSVYGYSAGAGYSQESMYPMNYFGIGAQQQQQQQFAAYYPSAAAAAANPGVFANYYPYYAQYSQSAQAHSGFGLHYPQMLQYPYLPQQFGSGSSTPILSLPASNAAQFAGSQPAPSTATDRSNTSS
ncbi:uncharacterized protein A4U43_C07F24700 [Asparagus officinalis]|uniref:RNA-binding protein 38 n=2 Tax=Asparagus officinalis TaxID=4686 RepID=A0A5P1EEQ3_ASPOF|nr:uncharacterized protein A4U43_C07F24700 [Asparagus officinalis]